MNIKTVRDIDVSGKRVLVRVDFNVPLDKDGNVGDNTRIKESLPTIRYLLKRDAKVILMSHLGRPQGKVVENLRMAPVARELGKLLEKEVKVAPDSVGPEVESIVESMKPGQVLMLENLRFHPEEEENDPDFAGKLASLADIYVNDAFGTAHRAHASTVGVAGQRTAVAGFLMEKELDALGSILEQPKHPFAAIIGGAKISTKIQVLESLLDRVDILLIGGGMANTFLKAKGLEIGKSLVEDDLVDTARDLMNRAQEKGVTLGLPTDVVVTEQLDNEHDFGIPTQAVELDQVPPGWYIVDIGPRTVQEFRSMLAPARTIFWNGPMGIFEISRFAEGTKQMAELLVDSGATTVVGGGDSVAAVEQMGYADRMSHMSTGGGAALEMIEGKTLPGVAVLQQKDGN